MTCFVVPGLTAHLASDPLDKGQIIAGDPEVSSHEILDANGVSVGIWEHTAGSSTDTEVDEVFVVLSGKATIDVVDGPVLEVGPGDVGVLEAGARTIWHVHESLRKIYLIRA